MDPGTIVAVITTSVVALKAFVGYCKDVNGTRSDKAQLQAEALSLVSLLISLQDDAKVANTADHHTVLSCFENIKHPLDLLKTAIEDLTKKLHVETRSRFRRVVDTAKWPLTKKEVADTLKIIERVKLLTVLAIDRDIRLLERESVKMIQELHEDVRTLKSIVEDEEAANLAAWLSPINFGARHAQHTQTLVPSTCEWILETAPLRDWLEGKTKLLFCYGPGGVGKTLLSSFIVSHVRNTQQDRSTLVLCAFCESSDIQTQSLGAFLGGLLRQALLCTKTAEEPCQSLYQAHRGDDVLASPDELLAALESVLKGFTKTYIIIDALDELFDEPSIYYGFLEALKGLTPSIQILYTSRTVETLRENHVNGVELEITGMPAEQLQTYILHRLKNNAALARIIGNDGKFRDEIVTILVHKSKGLILAASLYLTTFANCMNKRQLRTALTSLPTGLARIYDEMAGFICGSQSLASTIASRALVLVVFVRRPLLVEEIVSAIAIEAGAKHIDAEAITPIDTILSAAKGLLNVDKDTQVLTFAHQTAKEHFSKRQSELWPSGHAMVAEMCITYLGIDDFENSPIEDHDEMAIRKRDYPFLEYACFSWAHHAREAGETRLEDQIMALISQPRKLYNAVQFSPCFMESDFPRNQDQRNPLPIHLAAFSGLAKISDRLLIAGSDIFAPGPGGDTAFRLAVHECHDEILGLMAPQVPYSTLCKEVSVAAEEGLTSSVKLLINMGAGLEWKQEDGRTPLLLAIRAANQQLAELLIKHGADVTARDEAGNTALHYAARRGLTDLIQLLLRAGCGLNDLNLSRMSALFSACVHNQQDTVKLLLEHNANPCPTPAGPDHSKAKGNPRIISGRSRTEPSVNKTRPEPIMSYKSAITALHAAAYGGHPTILASLVDRFPALVDKGDEKGQTPLMYIASATRYHRHKGHRDWYRCIKILVEKDATVNALDCNGASALHHAADNPDGLPQLRALLQLAPDPNAANNSGETPLHLCSARRSLDMINELLVRGVKTDSRDARGNTPIMAAVHGHRYKTVGMASTARCIKLLMESRKTTTGVSAMLQEEFQSMVEHGDKQVLKLLHGLHGSAAWGNSIPIPALHLASYFGNLATVEHLLAAGATLEDVDVLGNCCLAYAVIKDHPATCMSIMRRQPSVARFQNKKGICPVDIAPVTARAEIIQCLGVHKDTVIGKEKYLSVISSLNDIRGHYPGFDSPLMRNMQAAQRILDLAMREQTLRWPEIQASSTQQHLDPSAPPSEAASHASRNSTDFGIGMSERSSELDRRFGVDCQYNDLEHVVNSRASNRSGSSAGSGNSSDEGGESWKPSSKLLSTFTALAKVGACDSHAIGKEYAMSPNPAQEWIAEKKGQIFQISRASNSLGSRSGSSTGSGHSSDEVGEAWKPSSELLGMLSILAKRGVGESHAIGRKHAMSPNAAQEWIAAKKGQTSQMSTQDDDLEVMPRAVGGQIDFSPDLTNVSSGPALPAVPPWENVDGVRRVMFDEDEYDLWRL